jgi:hypothetical protein
MQIGFLGWCHKKASNDEIHWLLCFCGACWKFEIVVDKPDTEKWPSHFFVGGCRIIL